MKPLPKLLLALTAVAAVMLAFTHNASALTFTDEHVLGDCTAGFSGAFSDADKTALVNHLIGQALQTGDTVILGTSTYSVHRSENDFGSLPGPAVIGPSGGGTHITIGSGTYSYIFAIYGVTTRAFVWYIGDLSGDITIPNHVGSDDLSGWTLFTAGGQGVPDGGTTAMLLGAALGALGMARRFLKV